MTIWWTVGAFVLVLTPIILIHEAGHFIAARLSGIRVEEFGIGFPPRAVKLFQRGDTLYSINWIPIGGFVRPAGEDDPTVPDGLAAASKRARLFTLLAGAGANFILAILIFWVAYMIGPPSYEVVITDLVPGSPAEASGVQIDDIILEVNGRVVDSNLVVKEETSNSPGQAVTMLVLRDGQEVTLEVVPRFPDEYDPAVEGATGITLTSMPTGENQSAGPVESVRLSIDTTFNIVWSTLRAPIMLIEGQITPAQARPVSVVGISQLAGRAAEETADRRDLFPLLSFTGIISVALGFTNLLPIPALDGGRILFVLLEAVRGRRIEPEREGMVHLVGMLFLLGLMVLIIVQDIINPVIPF